MPMRFEYTEHELIGVARHMDHPVRSVLKRSTLYNSHIELT